ncbi:SEC10/PgrA surface exclusion domain-containing protein [Streptococcus dysgalactiae]|uniref:SEC10/PgrA surface exclusion domain-containing protein n=1 Tax=Streptococcus dysgalactiae TaxID=1334 RepID=UPI0010CAB112|nr:SEC10/PgrA surface exclusion domain-containing protein [Streptococcus dysgalactiae]MDY2963113.1 SEC10/PgrA surface exclusion domain-containing protein [Streptococcus dysgalactiae]MEC4578426.1 SEC10/PgrA surface exclusion domain-containing protein [Streptococcus dysgalactiae]VTT05945.1 adhesion protein [Streptococcus dysgalactiae]
MTSKHTKVMLTSAALLTAVLSTTVQAQSETVEKPSSPQTVAMGTGRQSLEQQVQNQEKVVKELTEKVQIAKKNDEAAAQAVEQAKANEASASNVDAQKAEVASQILTAEKEVAVANEVVATETKDVAAAQAANQQAQEVLKVAESEAAKVSTEVKQPSTVKLDGDFAQALGNKNIPGYEENLQMMGPSNEFTFVSEASDETVVDINNLNDDQLTDLSHYTAGIINQVRNQVRKAGVQLNVGNAVVTKGSVKFAKDVAQNYRNDHWDAYTKSHDFDAINKAAASNGLQTVSGQNVYEDAGMAKSTSYVNHTFTMGELKHRITDAIQQMISNDKDSNWSHTESLVGTGISGEYLGTAISRVGDVVTVHILQVPTNRIQNSSAFDTAKINNPYEGEVNSPSNTSSARLASLKAAAKEKAEALATQQAELEKAQSHAAELTKTLLQLKEKETQLSKVQSGDQSALVAAADRKAQTARDLASMQAALDSATVKLDKLKEALATAPAKPEVPDETPVKPEARVETPSKPVQPEAPVKPEKLTPAIPQVPAVPEETPAKPMTPNNSAKPEASIPSKMDNISKSDMSGKKVVADKGNQAVSREMQPVQKVTSQVMATGPKATAYQALLPKTGETTNSVTVLGAFMLLLGSLPLVGSYMRKHH